MVDIQVAIDLCEFTLREFGVTRGKKPIVIFSQYTYCSEQHDVKKFKLCRGIVS